MTKAYYNISVASFVPTEDGGLIVENVPIMAVGSWTAMQGIRTVFSPEVLMRYAENWQSYGIWTRHPGGSPRDATEKIGVVRDPHYDPTIAGGAVVGDLYLHQRSSESRSAGQLVQTPETEGGISSVSAETNLELAEDGTVLSITFTGLALVDEGACATCRLKDYSKAEDREDPASAGEGKKMAEDEDKSVLPGNEEGAETEKTETDNQDGHEDQMAEGIEPKLIMLLATALDKVVPGTKDLIEETMKTSTDELITATNMGRLQQALMGCGGGKTYSKPDDSALRAEFEKQKKKVAMLEARFEKFGKETENNGHIPQRQDETESNEVMLDASIRSISRASLGGI